MKAAIILNGQIKGYDYIKQRLKDFDFIICADGGSNHAYNMDIIPDFILGDLDSIDNKIKEYYINKNVEFIKFPSKKDETDTELCIIQAKNIGATNISLVGALGGRIDHEIANINLLYYINNLGICANIIGENEDIFFTNGKIKINGNIGDTISILPIYKDARGISLKGLEYGSENFDMKFSSPIGISNVMISKECEINVLDGNLLIFKNHKI